MKLFIVLLVVCLQVSSAKAGGQVGNATESKPGAGVYKNGIYMTFGSAGVWTEAVSEESSTVPGLESLLSFIINRDLLSMQVRSDIYFKLSPSMQRRYYKVLDSKFDESAKKRLIEEYARSTSIKTSELSLFAVTDLKSMTTFLLPAFYKLKTIEQQAVLFHEAYWLLKPTASYEEVISAEVSFQKYLENSNDLMALFKVLLPLQGPTLEIIELALKVDQASEKNSHAKYKAVGLLANQKMLELDFDFYFGADFKKCIMGEIGIRNCFPFIATNLRNKKTASNSSALVSLLLYFYENTITTITVGDVHYVNNNVDPYQIMVFEDSISLRLCYSMKPVLANSTSWLSCINFHKKGSVK